MKPRYHEYFKFEQAKKERDLYMESNNTTNQLKNEFLKNNLIPEGPLPIDGSRHVQRQGKSDEWTYIAWHQTDKSGNAWLQCSAGLTNSSTQQDISIPIQKIMKNNS